MEPPESPRPRACAARSPSASPRAATTTTSRAPARRQQQASGGERPVSGTIRIDGSSTVYPVRPGGGRAVPGGRTPACRSRSASPAPAAASRSSAPARPTSPTPRARSTRTRRSRSARRAASSTREVQVANDGIAVVTNKAARDRLHDDRPAQGAVGDEPRSRTTRTLDPKLPDAEGQRSSARARTPARSTSSPRRSTAKRARRARTTSRPRTTTCSSRASPVTTAASATSASRTTSRTPDKLNLVGVDAGNGCVKPSAETIQDGAYKPLSRPLFMYPSSEGARQARGQGVHGLRGREPAADRRGGADRPDDRRAGPRRPTTRRLGRRRAR